MIANSECERLTDHAALADVIGFVALLTVIAFGFGVSSLL